MEVAEAPKRGAVTSRIRERMVALLTEEWNLWVPCQHLAIMQRTNASEKTRALCDEIQKLLNPFSRPNTRDMRKRFIISNSTRG
jgi:hypothetical protein